MKCPTCAAAVMVPDRRDVAYVYGAESTVIRAVTGQFCPACGESVLVMLESSRVSSAMLAFNRQVNANVADPEFALGASRRKRGGIR